MLFQILAHGTRPHERARRIQTNKNMSPCQGLVPSHVRVFSLFAYEASAAHCPIRVKYCGKHAGRSINSFMQYTTIKHSPSIWEHPWGNSIWIWSHGWILYQISEIYACSMAPFNEKPLRPLLPASAKSEVSLQGACLPEKAQRRRGMACTSCRIKRVKVIILSVVLRDHLTNGCAVCRLAAVLWRMHPIRHPVPL